MMSNRYCALKVQCTCKKRVGKSYGYFIDTGERESKKRCWPLLQRIKIAKNHLPSVLCTHLNVFW